jgi:hypothetical protein
VQCFLPHFTTHASSHNRRLNGISSYGISDLDNFKTAKNLKTTFFIRATSSKRKKGVRGSETMVEEQYCWAITQAAMQSYSGPSSSSLLEFGFQLDSFVNIYIVDQKHTQFRLARDLLERTVTNAYVEECLITCFDLLTVSLTQKKYNNYHNREPHNASDASKSGQSNNLEI